MRGRFIVLEGPDGAGKTSQAARLSNALRERGVANILTREPGGSPAAEQIRAILLGDEELSLEAQVRLHFQARGLHIKETIEPALATGQCVISDRFYLSTVAYQGFAQSYPLYPLLRLCEQCSVHPDLTIVLDVSAAAAEKRMAARTGRLDRYERMGACQQESVRTGYRMMAGGVFDNCVLIDADQPKRAVAARVLETALARMGRMNSAA